jgi:hypothetical protein
VRHGHESHVRIANPVAWFAEVTGP